MTAILTSPIDYYHFKSENLAHLEAKYLKLTLSDEMEQNYCELPDAITHMRAENEIGAIQNKKKNIEYQIQIEQFRMQQILDVSDLADQLHLTFGQLQTTVTPFDGSSIEDKIKVFLKNLSKILNKNFNNISTLAGNGDIATTDLEKLSPLQAGDGSTTHHDYYLGVVNHDQSPVNAMHPCFEKLIRACRLCLSTRLESIPNDPSLNEAIKLCKEAIDQDLPKAISSTGACVKNLEFCLESALQNEQVYANQLKTYGLEAKMRFLALYEEKKAALEISRSIMLQILSDMKKFSEMHF
jgi:hypothetical protein